LHSVPLQAAPKREVPGFRFQVSSLRACVSPLEFLVSDFRFHVSGFRFQVSTLPVYLRLGLRLLTSSTVTCLQVMLSIMDEFEDMNWTRLEEVTFVRRQRLILDHIDWEIAPGEHWVVLGANGSGKTTLLQLLAGYLWPTEGRITVLGERFGHTDLRDLRKRIGWVGSFLGAQIPPAQKPLDLIVSGKYASLGNFNPPVEQDYEEARELAQRFHCENILDLPYAVLSQGEKQRLLIARALIPRPQLLILDEPCAGLDLVAREQLLRSLEQLAGGLEAPTLILVTHHLEEIMPVWSHVLVLKGGRCLARGRKDEVLVDEVLSEAFDIAIQVAANNGRYAAHFAAG
jgi:iron complex transport system ATP-binding protein